MPEFRIVSTEVETNHCELAKPLTIIIEAESTQEVQIKASVKLVLDIAVVRLIFRLTSLIQL